MRIIKRKQFYHKKKILIISRYPISKNDYRWFFLNDLQNSYQLIKLSYDKYFLTNKSDFFVKKIHKILKTYKIELFIDLMLIVDINIRNSKYIKTIKKFYEIRKVIAQYKIKSLRFNHTSLSKWHTFPFLYMNKIRFIYKYVRNYFLEEYYKFPKTDYVCLAGKQGRYDIIDFKAKAFPFPHFDYFIYKQKKKNIKLNKNFIVYLDQNIENSHDARLINYQYTFSEFEKEMNFFFHFLKKKLNTDIIIAAHPKRNSKKKSILKKNWQMFHGLTAELVAKSAAVITHDSMSINYAILNSKPLIFLTTDQLENSDFSKNISNFSNYFKKKKINISRIDFQNYKFKKKDLFNYDSRTYKKYIKDFIISGKEKKFKIFNIIKNIIK